MPASSIAPEPPRAGASLVFFLPAAALFAMPAKPAFALPPATAAVRLSPRESASLHWSAIGKTSWETARILDISESTVNFHLRNACRKLQVRGRRAAVATAIRRGLLHSITA